MPQDRILVISDEEPIRESIASMLQAAGYQTREASSGMEALSILQSTGELELTLCALKMAEMDGIALLERCREKYPGMPVIVVSAVRDISRVLATIRNGAYDYLLMPFEREHLLAHTKRALNLRQPTIQNRDYRTTLGRLHRTLTPPSAQVRILIVDDEEPVREIIARMLNASGYRTRQACSGMDALAILNSSGEFDLMLADLMMAGLDGVALLERSKEKYPDMPVIVVTAVHDVSVALATIRSGAYDYLLKPFAREQLIAMIERALAHRQLQIENRNPPLTL